VSSAEFMRATISGLKFAGGTLVISGLLARAAV